MDLPDLLYRYLHTYQFTKEKNDLGKEITDHLGAGVHTIQGRKFNVKPPVTVDGWTKYEVVEVESKA